jgi:deferrochelatase/peroxidase EfeB
VSDGVGRRRFLQGAAAVLGGAAAGTVIGGAVAEGAARDDMTAPALRIPFHGTHQAGILTERQAAAAFVAFDLTTGNRAELTEALRTLTDRARTLTTGGVPRQLGISAPSADSGMLGDPVPADGLTVTVGLGASAFDDRFGLQHSKPARLREMDTFADDDLDPARCDGDLLVQLCAHDSDAVIHALRDLTRHTRGAMQIRWRVNGFLPPPRPAGAPRNLLGFKDGTANPDVADPKLMNSLVWVQPGGPEPGWTANGTYQVVRVIKTLVEFWDRVDLVEQERMIGRRRSSGAPLSGDVETDHPDYADDPVGATIPLDAHIRLANPRMPKTDESRILRRGYNYDAGVNANGNLDMGLVFSAFNQDLDRQFLAVQKRLAGEPLVDYISPVGGGYFFVLPGVRNAGDWYGRQLLA